MGSTEIPPDVEMAGSAGPDLGLAGMSRTEIVGRRMMRRARLISMVLAAILIALMLGIWALRPAAPPVTAGSATSNLAVPRPAVPSDIAAGAAVPAFTAPALRPGQPPVNLASDRGRPVVLNFFASWCHPCKVELPLLRSAWQRVGAHIHFVGVDVSDNRANALKLVTADRVGYQLAADPSGSLAVRFNLLNLPDTIFINARGKVIHTQVGQLTPKVLDTWLARLG
ncbi:MAG: TlpA family protein disulfide reductase [Acidimicrobiales bacterium]